MMKLTKYRKIISLKLLFSWVLVFGITSFHHHAYNIKYVVTISSEHSHDDVHNIDDCRIFDYKNLYEFFSLPKAAHLCNLKCTSKSLLFSSEFDSLNDFDANPLRGPPAIV